MAMRKTSKRAKTVKVRKAVKAVKVRKAVKTVKARKTVKAVKTVKRAAPKALSRKEIEILRCVLDDKTNAEIAEFLGVSQGKLKTLLSAIANKLGVVGRKRAANKAKTLGLLTPDRKGAEAKRAPVSIGIVGCGTGGLSLLNIFRNNPGVAIAWVSDKRTTAAGIKHARELKIPVIEDYKKAVQKPTDVIINVTGCKHTMKELQRLKAPDTELMGGLSAKVMWQLIDERRQRYEERERILKGHELLYKFGLIIEGAEGMADACQTIVDHARLLTGAPAGSLAVFDEKGDDMYVVASSGFSKNFSRVGRWKIRKGGLTGKILNKGGPLMVPSIHGPDMTSLLKAEGVKSVLASTLNVEKKIVGILYVNDFKERTFTDDEISLFSLLTIYAGLTIERVRAFEETRLLSITDGLTGLYNHRFLMEEMHRELQRASRYRRQLSIIMLDIDHFKKYNDKYGHIEGNKVLKCIARILRYNSRDSDTVGRFGGEEFCIVLPEIDKQGAHAFAERLIRKISAHPMPNRKVTVSGGISTYPDDGRDHIEILRVADKYLYDAKAKGRDTVCS